MKQFIEKLNTKKWVVPTVLTTMLFVLILAFYVAQLSLLCFVCLVGFFVCVCVVLDFSKVLGILLFLMSFAHLTSEIKSIPFYSVLCGLFVGVFGIKYLIDVVNKKNKIYWLPAILTFVIILYGFINLNTARFTVILHCAIGFLICYLCFVNCKQIKTKKLIWYYTIGIFVSSILALVLNMLPFTSSIAITSEGRFMACLQHPNTLHMLVLISISLFVYMLFKGKVGNILFYPVVAMLSAIGFTTQSKAFILCWAILFCIFTVFSFIKYKEKAIIPYLVVFMFALTMCFLFQEKVVDLFERFTKYDYANFLDKITTGRYSIWKKYLAEWGSSFLTVVFGCGVTAPYIVKQLGGNGVVKHLGEHSTYFGLIYRYGIIGLLLIFALIGSYIYLTKDKKKRFNIINFIPLAMFLVLGLAEYLFETYIICAFVLCVILLFNDEKQEETSMFESKLKFVKSKDLLSVFLMCLAFVPAMITKIFVRDFWLVCEVENEARDNGYWFFKHVREKHPEQKIAYAISTKCADYNKVKDLGKIVRYGGLAHWFWYFVADKNISSQKNGKPNAAICYLLEVILKLRPKNRIFLQHGIIASDLEYIHYENARVYKFIVSTKQEYEFVSDNFGYPEGTVCLAGLTRFDALMNANVNNKQILVMPTWRQWISKEIDMKEIEGSDKFEETNYFKHWFNFLNSEKLNELLEKYDKKLVFYPHRNMQKYLDKFTTNSDRITIASDKGYDVQTLLKESALLITDYSSVFFDFAYMKKPVLFYQFDEKQFRKYHLAKGYFDYHNNPLGDWSGVEEETLKLLEKYLENGLVKENINEVDEYFSNRDDRNCERNYQVVKYGKVLDK